MSSTSATTPPPSTFQLVLHRFGVENDAGQPLNCHWPDDFLSPTECADKMKAPCVFSGRYLPGKGRERGRTADNIEHREALAWLDYDQNNPPGTMERASKHFATIDHVIYTTHSHQTEAERFRVVLRLSRRVTAAEYRALLTHLSLRAAAAMVPFGLESLEPARMYFMPSHRPGTTPRAWHRPGVALEVDAVLECIPLHAERASYPPLAPSVWDRARSVVTSEEGAREIEEWCKMAAAISKRESGKRHALYGLAHPLGHAVVAGLVNPDEGVRSMLVALRTPGSKVEDYAVAEKALREGMVHGMQEALAGAGAVGPGPREGLPEIEVTAALGDTVRLAIQALHLSEARLGLYQHDGGIAEITHVAEAPGDGARNRRSPPRIRRVPPAGLLTHLSDAARFSKLTAGKETGGPKPTKPPRDVADAIHEMRELPFRVLTGIATAPTLRPDGSVLSEPGYDPTTGLFLSLPPGLEVVVGETREDAQRALATLAEPFGDFRFEHEHHRSATLAMVATLAARATVARNCPLFLVQASTPKTGKTLLVDVVTTIVYGRALSRTPYSSAEEEQRKLITTVAKAGAPALFFDNVGSRLGSAALDAALTGDEWSDRLLGGNEQYTCRLRTVWVASGNNVSLQGDLATRTIPIVIQTDVERPETRTEFKIKDLLSWTMENRPRLLSAALTIVSAYLLAGRPEVALDRGFGGFESWSRTIRSALVWAGAADPLAGAANLAAEADPELDEMRQLMAAWHGVYASDERTLHDVGTELRPMAMLSRDPARSVLTAVLAMYAGRDGAFDARRLAEVLRKWQGRIVDGRRWMKAGMTHGVVRWRLEAVAVGFQPPIDP